MTSSRLSRNEPTPGTTFLMRGATGVRYHGSHSRTKLEIRGHISMSGPQPVSDNGGVPELVHQLFQQFPQLQQVALGAADCGVVFQRIQEES